MSTIAEVVRRRQRQAVENGLAQKAYSIVKTLGKGGTPTTYSSPNTHISYSIDESDKVLRVEIPERGTVLMIRGGFYDNPETVTAYVPGPWEKWMEQDTKVAQQEADRRVASQREKELADARKRFGITDMDLNDPSTPTVIDPTQEPPADPHLADPDEMSPAERKDHKKLLRADDEERRAGEKGKRSRVRS